VSKNPSLRGAVAEQCGIFLDDASGLKPALPPIGSIATGWPDLRILMLQKEHGPMKFEAYVAALRRRRSQLEADRALITERGARTRSRWGSTPFVDTTRGWLAELDRRIGELWAIIMAFEKRYAI